VIRLRAAFPGVAVVSATLVTGCAEPVDPRWAPPATPTPAPAPPAPARPAPVGGAGSGSFEAVRPFERGRASFYSDRLAGRRTAAGEPYDPGAFTAAHRTLPLGSVVDVARLDGRHVTVRINDRGPHVRGRVIDLSRRAAVALGMVREGVADVVLRVVSVPLPR
jgi:rare lipoprotein A